jgi:hypothetical protein
MTAGKFRTKSEGRTRRQRPKTRDDTRRGPRRHGKSTRGWLASISGIEARAFRRKCWPRGRGPRGQSAIETYDKKINVFAP